MDVHTTTMRGRNQANVDIGTLRHLTLYTVCVIVLNSLSLVYVWMV